VVVVRDGKNLKGRLLGFVLGTIGRRVLEGRLATVSRLSKPERRGERGSRVLTPLKYEFRSNTKVEEEKRLNSKETGLCEVE
jgi:hypothetical protein